VAARQYTAKILFVGVPPINHRIVMFKGYEYSSERVRVYERRMQDIVTENGLPFVPLCDVFEHAGLDKLYTYDDLHPNDAGHQLIADTVHGALQKMLEGQEAL
jgi:lysophospholipase L1-like esterase